MDDDARQSYRGASRAEDGHGPHDAPIHRDLGPHHRKQEVRRGQPEQTGYDQRSLTKPVCETADERRTERQTQSCNGDPEGDGRSAPAERIVKRSDEKPARVRRQRVKAERVPDLGSKYEAPPLPDFMLIRLFRRSRRLFVHSARSHGFATRNKNDDGANWIFRSQR